MVQKAEKIRVALILSLEGMWLGGINYYRNLINAVYEQDDNIIEFIIFTGMTEEGGFLLNMPNVKVIRTKSLTRYSLNWFIGRLSEKILGSDINIIGELKKHKIQVLSHAAYPLRNKDIGSTTWIPDFQHIHFPEYFSQNEIKKRNKNFKNLCETSDLIILSSDDAKRDLGGFAPEFINKVSVLNFHVKSPGKYNVTEYDRIQQKYDLPEKYFFLPNQYWIHKNHKVVLNAIKLLREQDEDIAVISTGASDPLNLDYFKNFKNQINIHNLKKHYRMLGVVPYNDVSSLMFFSHAVINPSSFEGWSTTVEEARAMGKKLLLSDINVHREQSPEGCIFFNLNDSEELSNLMKKTWYEFKPEPNQDLMRAGAITSVLRRKFANKYQEIIKKAKPDNS